MIPARFDMVVLGSGPAGQNAALEAVRGGRSVLLVEQDRGVGGACVHSGTIPLGQAKKPFCYRCIIG